jgi:hypothetical protein
MIFRPYSYKVTRHRRIIQHRDVRLKYPTTILYRDALEWDVNRKLYPGRPDKLYRILSPNVPWSYDPRSHIVGMSLTSIYEAIVAYGARQSYADV